MQYKRQILSIVIVLEFGLTSLLAQTLCVQGDSVHAEYSINDIRKISFSIEGLNITNNNSRDVFSLNKLNCIKFACFQTNKKKNFFVYPNPVSDVLNVSVSQFSGKGTLSIITLDGKLLSTFNILGSGLFLINLSYLKHGLYLIRYMNGIDIRTVKIIK